MGYNDHTPCLSCADKTCHTTSIQCKILTDWFYWGRTHCPSCHYAWDFDDSNIPKGAKYEIECPKCGLLMLKQKSNK